jgi:hypothetical protein
MTLFTDTQVKKYIFTDKSELITTVMKNSSRLVIGTSSGALYQTDVLPQFSPYTMELSPFTSKVYEKIHDISSYDSAFYFLTDTYVYKSSYFTSSVDTIASNEDGYTQIIPYNDTLILWSKDTRKPILQIFPDDFNHSEELFTPDKSLHSLRLFKNTLVYIEANSTVSTYSLTDHTTTRIYTGTGIQDALLYTDNELYVAKSASSNPKSALIQVNIRTKETVLLPLTGDIAFSLTTDPAMENSPIYGISVSANGLDKKTIVFAYSPTTKDFTTLLQWADEDTDAFTVISNSVLYTNIGKTQIRSYELQTGKNIQLTRSASLPSKITRNEVSVLVLNRDGSISWYNPGSMYVLGDWYLTIDELWNEY